jgi:predicted N-acetyltransferase YhbS
MSKTFECRTLSKGDEKAVRLLVESTFPVFSTRRFWDWKYLQNPGFDRSLAAVALMSGKIIGCNHWLPRQIKLSDAIVVESMLGANIAVAPEYRQKGVGRALIHFLRLQHPEQKPPLMYMFADPELQRRFHARVGGYIPVPDGTVLFRKILNWNKVILNTTTFNERVKHGEFGDRLAQVDLTVAFKMPGAPPLRLHLDSGGVEMDGSIKRPDVTVSSDMTTFSRVKDGQIGVRTLIWLCLTGRLKIRGGLRKIYALYRNMWVLREILRTKIT